MLYVDPLGPLYCSDKIYSAVNNNYYSNYGYCSGFLQDPDGHKLCCHVVKGRPVVAEHCENLREVATPSIILNKLLE